MKLTSYFIFILLFSTNLLSQETGTLTDIENNIYKTVKIGDQWWMAENLKTTHFSDGNHIPVLDLNSSWMFLNSAAYCWYDQDINNRSIHGALYNWFVVNEDICPSGWHIPDDSEWNLLINTLGGEEIAGGKLKQIGTSNWFGTQPEVTNSSGFTALPSGHLSGDGFDAKRSETFFWSATERNEFSSNSFLMFYGDIKVSKLSFSKNYYKSIRCIKSSNSSNLSISGTVIDIEGADIENVTVEITWPNYQQTTTNSSGEFSFNKLLPNSNYTLKVQKDGYFVKVKYNIDITSGDKEVNLTLENSSSDLVISNIAFNRNSYHPDYDFSLSLESFFKHEFIETSEGFNYISLLNSGLWAEIEIYNPTAQKQGYSLYMGLKAPSGKVHTFQKADDNLQGLAPGEKINKLIHVQDDKLIQLGIMESHIEEGEWLLSFQLNSKSFNWDEPQYSILVTDDIFESGQKTGFENFLTTYVAPSEENFRDFSVAEQTKSFGKIAAFTELLSILNFNGGHPAADYYRGIQEIDKIKLAPLSAATINTDLIQSDISGIFNLSIEWDINKMEYDEVGWQDFYTHLNLKHQYFDRAVIILDLSGDANIISSNALEIIENKNSKSLIWVFEGIDKQIFENKNPIELIVQTNSIVDYKAYLHLQYGPTRSISGINAPLDKNKLAVFYDYENWLSGDEQIYFNTISLNISGGKIYYIPTSDFDFDYISSEGRYYNLSVPEITKSSLSLKSTTSESSLQNGNSSDVILIQDRESDLPNNNNIGLIGQGVSIDSSGCFPLLLKVKYSDDEISGISEDSLVFVILDNDRSYYSPVDFELQKDSNQIVAQLLVPGIYNIGYKGLKSLNVLLNSDFPSDTFAIVQYVDGDKIDSISTADTFHIFDNLGVGDYIFEVKSSQLVKSLSKVYSYDQFANNDTIVFDFSILPETPVIKSINRIDSTIFLRLDNPNVNYALKVYYDTVSNPPSYSGINIIQGSSPIVLNSESHIELKISDINDLYFKFSYLVANTLESSLSEEFTINRNINNVKILPSTSSTCYGDSILLTIENLFPVKEWSNGSYNDSIYVRETGLYAVTATDSSGYISSDQVHVNFTKYYQSVFDTICSNEARDFEYSGIYYDTLSSITGCDSIIALMLTIHSAPEIYLGADTTVFANDSIILSAHNSYLQYYWNASLGDSTFQVYHENTGDYEYTLKVIDVNNCTNSDTIKITVLESNSIIQYSDWNNLIIYPNPTNERIFIHQKKRSFIDEIRIYDLNGKLLRSNYTNKTEGIEIDVSGLTKGMYVLWIKSEKKENIYKILKY